MFGVAIHSAQGADGSAESASERGCSDLVGGEGIAAHSGLWPSTAANPRMLHPMLNRCYSQATSQFATVGDQLRFFAGSFGGAPGPLLFLSKNSMPAFVGTVSTIAAPFRPCHAGLVWFRLNDLTVVIWVWSAPSHHKNLFGALLGGRGNCLRWLAKGPVHQL